MATRIRKTYAYNGFVCAIVSAGPRYSAHYIGVSLVPRGPLVVSVVGRWDMTRSAIYVVIDLASPFTNEAGDVLHTYFEAYSSPEYCTVLTPSNTAIIGIHMFRIS